MTIIICYTQCWQCQFAEKKRDHPRKVHTWMDDEDIEHRGEKVPSTPEEWTALGEKQPCACWCAKPTRSAIMSTSVSPSSSSRRVRSGTVLDEREADEAAALAWREGRDE